MAENNNKNPKEKRPGEKPDGTYHFNPGNQSGKGPVRREESEKAHDKNAPEEKRQR